MMKFKKMISVFFAVTMLFTMFAVNTLAAYVNIKQDTRVVENIECISSSKYDTSSIIGYSIMASLRGSETVTLKASVTFDVIYTTGEPYYSNIVNSEQIVCENGYGPHAAITYKYDSSRLISYFRFYHYYYVNGECIEGVGYIGDYGVDNTH